jgi:hypothetical protein
MSNQESLIYENAFLRKMYAEKNVEALKLANDKIILIQMLKECQEAFYDGGLTIMANGISDILKDLL